MEAVFSFVSTCVAVFGLVYTIYKDNNAIPMSQMHSRYSQADGENFYLTNEMKFV